MTTGYDRPTCTEPLVDDHARPLVLVDITGGAEQAIYTFAGTGEPNVHVCDFDTEGIDDDREQDLIDGWELFAALIRDRSLHPSDIAQADEYQASADALRRRAALAEV